MNALDLASHLASRGLPCFPCRDNKAPACPGGFKAASCDGAELRRLWHAFPGSLVGVPTGAATFDVLDIDPRHGGDVWIAEHGARLPATRVHLTRGGGRHMLFRHSPGLRSSAGKISLGVDVRAEGGYVIWWPAFGGHVLTRARLATWPTWLVAILLPPPSSLTSSPTRSIGDGPGDSCGVGALRYAVERVAAAPEGARNATLNAQCYWLARKIPSGILSPAEIADALAVAALHAGLDRRETAATLASALRAGGAG